MPNLEPKAILAELSNTEWERVPGGKAGQREVVIGHLDEITFNQAEELYRELLPFEVSLIPKNGRLVAHDEMR